MRPGARMAAAAEVLDVVLNRHRPASNALADWGRANRFAGSGDRAAIGNLVFDALRRRHTAATSMGDGSPRALILGSAAGAFQITPAEVIAAANDGSPHSIGPLTDVEVAALDKTDAQADLASLPPHIEADFPEQWTASLTRTFNDRLIPEMSAFRDRAPVGLRANTLKADQARVMKALAKFNPVTGRYAPNAVIVPHPLDARRTPAVEAAPEHGRGWFEVQDEGSQIVSALAGAGPRDQVLDMCAGAGGKTLSIGAAMHNTGQIYAYDRDPRQLRPIFERLKRAGVRNVQTIPPGETETLAEYKDRFDLVFIDAPCTGSGTWRRRPDTKWRLTEANLETRLAEQRDVLELARPFVKPGGRLVYVTCSVLAEENIDQTRWFTDTASEYEPEPYKPLWETAFTSEAPQSADGATDTLLLTPASHGTDGFFFAAFRRT